MSLWHRFSIIFVNDLKSRKVFVVQYFFDGFRTSKPLIVRSVFHRFLVFFQNRSPGTVFRRSQCRTLIKNCFRIAKKVPFGPPFCPSRRKKTSPPNGPGCPSTDPVFHETIIITVAFGPSGF